MATKTAKKQSTSSRSSSSSSGSRSDAKTTTNHDKIRKWAEQRGANPATVKSTKKGGVGLLRLDFPGYSGKDTLQKISWDDFFEKFDEQELAFLYQEKTASGRTSRFSKFINKPRKGK